MPPVVMVRTATVLVVWVVSAVSAFVPSWFSFGSLPPLALQAVSQSFALTSLWAIEDVAFLEIVRCECPSEPFLQAADTEEMTGAVWFADELSVARLRPDTLPDRIFHGVPFAEAVPASVDATAAAPSSHVALAEVSRAAGF